MSDNYPEYLNPFAEDVKPKNKLSISHSFKEFKRTLRQSFRIKKKEEEPVTIRQKTDTIQRQPVSYPNYRMNALPRSRFQERVKCEPSTSSSGPNPFEEEEENKNFKNLTIRKKTKKKAPLPPKSLSSQDVNNDNLEVPSRGSHWSLTSGDTNYSSSIQENGEDDVEEVSEVVLEKVIDFNKEMEKLKDDSNNNTITADEISEMNDSTTDISKQNNSCLDESKQNNSCSDESNQNNSCPDNLNDNKLENNNEETDTSLPKEHSENNFVNSSNVENDIEGVVSSDITNDVICENNINGTSTDDDEGTETNDKEPFLYYEKQSLYIAGSKDELNESDTYTNRVSMHISENSDDLDVSNNNDENQSDKNKNESENPVPKQRKNKLSKNALLGM